MVLLPAEKHKMAFKSHITLFLADSFSELPIPSLTVGAAQVMLHEHRVEVGAGRLWRGGCVRRGGERRRGFRFCFCDTSEGDFVSWFSF